MNLIKKPPVVAFQNANNPKSFFDMVQLQKILGQTPHDHNPAENHSLSFFGIFIISKGKGKHTIDFKTYDYKKGSVFLLRKGVTHKFTKSNANGLLVIFTQDFVLKHLGNQEGLKSLQLFNHLLESPKVQLCEETFSDIEVVLNQLANESKLDKDIYTSSIKRSFLHVIISKLYRERERLNKDSFSSKYLDQLLVLQDLIEQHWHINKSVNFYAEKMAVTSKTLNNIVKATLKKSAKALVDDIVCIQIKHLLVNTDLSVTEIAYQSGFNDPTNFFKYFKKNTTLSPNQFRAKHK